MDAQAVARSGLTCVPQSPRYQHLRKFGSSKFPQSVAGKVTNFAHRSQKKTPCISLIKHVTMTNFIDRVGKKITKFFNVYQLKITHFINWLTEIKDTNTENSGIANFINQSWANNLWSLSIAHEKNLEFRQSLLKKKIVNFLNS